MPNQADRTWTQRLAERWGVSPQRVLVILLVFALTGFTVMFLKRPLVSLFTEDGAQPILFTVIYYVLILPFYNLLLLAYGAVFGQFRFFWEFEKKFFRRMFGRTSSASRGGAK
ncbi:MAG: DUF6787 family protein [Flavobacteriales bacterium]